MALHTVMLDVGIGGKSSVYTVIILRFNTYVLQWGILFLFYTNVYYTFSYHK